MENLLIEYTRLFGTKEYILLFWLFSSAIRLLGTVVYSAHYTEVRFASFLSGGFTTMAVINPLKRNLEYLIVLACVKIIITHQNFVVSSNRKIAFTTK